MSTSLRQSADAKAAHHQRLDALLRHCIECGLCLPHCATYLATGNEADSPRGRLILLQAVLKGSSGAELGAAAGPDEPAMLAGALAAFDRCIGCRACETTCPSGVPFDLLAHGQSLAVGTDWAAKAPGVALLDRRPLLALLRRLAGSARTLAQVVAGRNWRRRLSTAPAGVANLVRLLGSLPTAPQHDRTLCELLDGRLAVRSPDAPAAESTGRPTRHSGFTAAEPRRSPPGIVFFRGCANGGLLPGTSHRLQELLVACGCRVVVPAGQQCCGAVAAHTGRPRRAADLHDANLAALTAALGEGDVLVAEAAGCGLELRDYPAPIAAAVSDAVVLLAGLELPPLAPVPLRVAIHDPCHARHGLGIVAEPRALLRRIPQLTVVEPEEAEVCCGSGGTYSLRHRSLAAAMGHRKAEVLARTGADLVVTSNPGCLGQIADGLALEAPDLPILPLTDLVWYAWCRAR